MLSYHPLAVSGIVLLCSTLGSETCRHESVKQSQLHVIDTCRFVQYAAIFHRIYHYYNSSFLIHTGSYLLHYVRWEVLEE